MIAAINVHAVDISEFDSLKVVSNNMTYNLSAREATFTGDVKVDDGNAKLTCEQMKVYLDSQDQLKLIVCTGNVIIRKEQSTTYSEHAKYSIKDSVVTLMGNARVLHVNEEGQKSTSKGKVIIYNLKNETIEIHDSVHDIKKK